jgi:hypothetical protein
MQCHRVVPGIDPAKFVLLLGPDRSVENATARALFHRPTVGAVLGRSRVASLPQNSETPSISLAVVLHVPGKGNDLRAVSHFGGAVGKRAER